MIGREILMTPIGMYPYQLMFDKSCHLPIDIDQKVMWALKNMNLDCDVASNKRINELNGLDEFRLIVYVI